MAIFIKNTNTGDVHRISYVWKNSDNSLYFCNRNFTAPGTQFLKNWNGVITVSDTPETCHNGQYSVTLCDGWELTTQSGGKIGTKAPKTPAITPAILAQKWSQNCADAAAVIAAAAAVGIITDAAAADAAAADAAAADAAAADAAADAAAADAAAADAAADVTAAIAAADVKTATAAVETAAAAADDAAKKHAAADAAAADAAAADAAAAAFFDAAINGINDDNAAAFMRVLLAD